MYPSPDHILHLDQENQMPDTRQLSDLRSVGPAAIELADAEGLPAHARSIEVRLGI